MDSNNSFKKRMERFIGGKGYYIALAVCAAIIGLSIWSLLRDRDPAMPETTLGTRAIITTTTPAPTPTLPTPEPPEIDEEAALPVQPDLPEDDMDPADEPTDATDPAAAAAAESVFVWPLEGDVQRPYSVEALLYDATMSDWRIHDGVDIAAPVGEKVSAITSGTVQQVYHDDRYGTTVTIDHGNGLICMYSNLEEIPTVYVGDFVSAGDTIGSVGATCMCESAQESHLHLAATRNGSSISPLSVLPQKN